MSTVFRIRIQERQDSHTWKTHLEFHQDEALREKRGLFQFKPEDFSALQGLSLKDYGTYLGKTLFKEYELRDFFISAFQNSEQLMKVALSVEVDESAESQKLKTLHWERLCVPIEDSWEYLALHQRLPFAHHVSTGNLRRYSLIQKEDLRALIVIANPDGLEEEYDLAAIDVDTTVGKIKAALGDIPCDILANHSEEALGLPTLKQVREQLSIANPPYTILHIVSHGRVDSKGETTLYWSDEEHQVEPIKDKHFIEQLRVCEHLPHLIFLCCCSSASFFQGLAQKLIEKLGTPAVIAMTDKVSITTGIALTENFYPRLRESGNVDIALKRAAAPLAERYDITVPALFSYRINSALFGIQVNITGGSDYAIQVFAQSTSGNLASSSSALPITEPYKFLSYYNTSDADIFFGREAITEQLVSKIISHKIVLINGKSGSGKTSLINAGIIPGLMDKGYFTLIFRDYRYPTESIKAGLTQLEQVNINLDHCQTLLECLQATIKQTGQPIVIILDQFERFFLNLPEAQWRQFAQELKDCLNASDTQQMNIVIALRVDFYGQLGEFWDDIPEINTESYQQYLKPLNVTEATAAIEKPLEKVEENIEYDPDFLTQCLVPSLLQGSSSKSQEQIEPVHLQIVCNQLFEAAKSHYTEKLKQGKWVAIKQDIYDELGGVEGILQGYVEVILNRHYSPNQQETVKSILKQMVSSQGTRVYQSIGNIAAHLNFEPKVVEEVIEKLDQSRLIETVSDKKTGEKKHSITHDYLAKHINQWYTLHELELQKARELYDRCLQNWKLNSRNRIPRSQLKDLRKYKSNLLTWKPEGKQLFKESEWLYHALNGAVIGGLATLTVVALAAFTGQTEATIGKVRSSQQASEFFLNSRDRQLEGLIEVLRAKTLLQNNRMLRFSKPNPSLSTRVRATSWKAFYQTQERHRLWHQDWVYSHDISFDSQSIVTTSKDGTAQVWNRQGKLISTLEGHQDQVYDGRFSPNGYFIVTASKDKTAMLWNPSGDLLVVLQGHEDEINTARFSQDGNKIVTASNDGTAKVWDLNAKLLTTLSGHQDLVMSAQFSPDGSRMITASYDGTAKVWNSDGKLLQTLNHDSFVWNAQFSPDSKTIVTASFDKTAKLWDLEGKLLATLEHPAWVWNANFSPDGNTIITADEAGTPRLWNLKGELLQIFEGHRKPIFTANFSPDGQTIVTPSKDGTAKIWNLNGQLLATLGHRDVVYSASFSPVGDTVVTTSEDGTAKIWNINGQQPIILTHQQGVWHSEFSPDENFVLSASEDSTAKLWNRKGELIATLEHTARVYRAHFNPNGDAVITTSIDGTAKLWDLEGQQLATFNHEEGVLSAAFSPDHQLVVTASRDGIAKVWNLEGELLTTLQHQKQINYVHFSPNGNLIVTASNDNTAKLWNLEGELLATLQHEYWVITAEFSPDGETIVTASDDKTAAIWNLEGERLTTLKGHQDAVNSAKFSPDGKMIITASLDDNTARIWNLEGELQTTLWHSSAVWKANFSPDDQTVVTAADDGNARVWNLKGQLLATLTHDELVNSASFSPDGDFIVTASMDGSAKVWPFPTLSELMIQACDRVGNYLKYSPNVSESDRHLCDQVSRPRGP